MRRAKFGFRDTLGQLPVDPDVDPDVEPRLEHGAKHVEAPGQRPRMPRLSWPILAAVFVGGFIGGLARYGISFAVAPRPDTFPWDVFAINVAGAFCLALLLVLVTEILRPTRYLRPAFGTGFLGAFTTFSSLTVASDQLMAHGHAGIAAAYVLSSLFAGLAAASFGLVVGRAIGAYHVRGVADLATSVDELSADLGRR
jgi:CrcB protein